MRSLNGAMGTGASAQGQGFLIGKLSDVVPSPEGRNGRYIIQFDDYAEINVPDMAYEWRNPVRYIELEDFNIDPTKLTWKRVVPDPQHPYEPSPRAPKKDEPHAAPPPAEAGVRPLDMTEAKKALAAYYNVPAQSIEITIRGVASVTSSGSSRGGS